VIGFNVTTSGPLFDGRAARAVRDFCNEFPQRFAEDSVKDLHGRFQRVFKHPTGAYQSQVRAKRLRPGTSAITSDSPYGPWLEGAGSRNQKSQFKGYNSFGWIRFKMERTIEPVANAKFHPYLRRMT
jgi:hypothetical protein